MGSILGIYAQENGQGMMFEPEPTEDPTPPQGPKAITPPPPKPPRRDSLKSKPSLRVIK
jgi:stringent starvation protein B